MTLRKASSYHVYHASILQHFFKIFNVKCCQTSRRTTISIDPKIFLYYSCVSTCSTHHTTHLRHSQIPTLEPLIHPKQSTLPSPTHPHTFSSHSRTRLPTPPRLTSVPQPTPEVSGNSSLMGFPKHSPDLEQDTHCNQQAWLPRH